MNWCPCVHGLLSFCGVHGAPSPTPAETKLRISRDKWRAYAERLEKEKGEPMTATEIRLRTDLHVANATIKLLEGRVSCLTAICNAAVRAIV
jgi:hypothetical protein